ncbi:MAG: sodium-translocating pyrophosphatase [Planctomycetota bacterium]|nr:sodium-translocating pyrophosphatase [Planctomycetota bacterium]
MVPLLWYAVPVAAVLALLTAFLLHRRMVQYDAGSERMQKIASYVRTGAMAYLRQQYKIVGITFVILAAILVVVAFVFHAQSVWVPFAFLTGGFFSALSGFLGMNTSTLASSRTTMAAQESLDKGLKVAFRSGAVMGLVVVGLALLDISAWFYVLYVVAGLELREVTLVMLCFGMGASTQALFARVGGGIFTKSADVGADLVGKVEAGIPEDDPRNPAVVADNVGDNVGDVAGMGADLYESFCGSILATAALGVAAGLGMGGVMCPMLIAGVGAFLSIIGILSVRLPKGAGVGKLLSVLNRGINLSSVLVLVASAGLVFLLLRNVEVNGEALGTWRVAGIWGSIVVGLLAGVGIGYSTSYYTSANFSPVKGIAEQARKGAATLMIDGLAVGMWSTGLPVLIVAVGIMLSFALAGGFSNYALGLYGVSIASVGMLSTLAITLATDAYGPIADNAGGIAQMAGLPPEVRERTDALDSLGNTTAAIGKGFAIGSAALTALALLASYVEEVRIGIERQAESDFALAPAVVVIEEGSLREREMREVNPRIFAAMEDKHPVAYIQSGKTNKGEPTVIPVNTSSIPSLLEAMDVSLMNPRALVGLFIGGMMVFVFCAMTMKAVGRAAGRMVEEVRRQFREIKGLMEGTAEADYARCVAIATQAAQHEMIAPSIVAVLAPIVMGLVLGVAGVMGLLAGSLSTGFIVAVMMANAGGAWDNAKKLIEGKKEGGKGSPEHKASVVGDTVGDPFKDTAGPSLNILLKLMAMVSIVFAGVILKFGPQIHRLLGFK